MRLTLLAVLFVVSGGPAWAEPPKVKMDDETRRATGRALEWLSNKQNADGSWSDTSYPHNTAITSFALLAFMSQGHTPNEGQYAPEVGRGVRFLMASQRPRDGYLVGARGGNMYCHSMATLALGEAYGMTGDEAIRRVLKSAVDLIVGCQSYEGGWRYEPVQSGADVSVTIMTVMALRSAKNGGLHVPDVTLRKAIDYIGKCYEPASGGFRYQPGSYGSGFARTAAGACVLQLAGEYDDPRIGRAVDYLKRNFRATDYFWYGHYYAAHAMHFYGTKPGREQEWADWYARIRERIIGRQASSGEWVNGNLDSHSAGVVYQTSIAVVILSIPMNYLPIYQR